VYGGESGTVTGILVCLSASLPVVLSYVIKNVVTKYPTRNVRKPSDDEPNGFKHVNIVRKLQ
jgi:hypothetical protein